MAGHYNRLSARENSYKCSLLADFTLTFVPVLQRGHHIEADSLVGALFQDRGGETLVCSSQSCRAETSGFDFSCITLPHHWMSGEYRHLRSAFTLSPDDLLDSVEEAPVFWVGRCLVVDEFNLER